MWNVVWLGGGSGSGKSTLARALADRLDLRLYPMDAYTFAHLDRVDPKRHPTMAAAASASYRDLHVVPSPSEQADRFVEYAREQLSMVLEDLVAMPAGPTVIVEGPGVLPDPVADLIASPRHGLWLLPTVAFSTAALSSRVRAADDDEDARTAAVRRTERDRLLVERFGADARRRGLVTAVVDGSLSVDESVEAAARHFGPVVTRARDGATRSRMRRAENAVVRRQLAAFARTLTGPNDLVFGYACECGTLGCGERVHLPLVDAVDAPIVAPDHG